MIKDDLGQELAAVQKRLASAKTDREHESAMNNIDRSVFWTAFAIRKLVESLKLTNSFESSTWKVTEHPKRPHVGKAEFLNAHHIDRLYDVERGRAIRLPLNRLCNGLIHSFVFVPVMAEDARAVAGFFFNSDFTKDRCLYLVEWHEWSRLVGALCADDVVEARANRLTGDHVRLGTDDPPAEDPGGPLEEGPGPRAG